MAPPARRTRQRAARSAAPAAPAPAALALSLLLLAGAPLPATHASPTATVDCNGHFPGTNKFLCSAFVDPGAASINTETGSPVLVMQSGAAGPSVTCNNCFMTTENTYSFDGDFCFDPILSGCKNNSQAFFNYIKLVVGGTLSMNLDVSFSNVTAGSTAVAFPATRVPFANQRVMLDPLQLWFDVAPSYRLLTTVETGPGGFVGASGRITATLTWDEFTLGAWYNASIKSGAGSGFNGITSFPDPYVSGLSVQLRSLPLAPGSHLRIGLIPEFNSSLTLYASIAVISAPLVSHVRVFVDVDTAAAPPGGACSGGAGGGAYSVSVGADVHELFYGYSSRGINIDPFDLQTTLMAPEPTGVKGCVADTYGGGAASGAQAQAAASLVPVLLSLAVCAFVLLAQCL